jgi:hypothetical protein
MGATYETLAKRYDRLFENYVNSMEDKLEELARTKGRNLTTSLKPGRSGLPAAPISGPSDLSGIVPVKEPICFDANFGIRLTEKAQTVLTGTSKFLSWEDTYIYQDGAFRLVGHGAWPFWVWQDRFDENKPEGPYVPSPLDLTAATVDEVIPFEMDKVVAALKPAMESEGCNVTQETPGRIECKRPRGYSYSEHMAYGGESEAAVLEAQGNQTHVPHLDR